MTKWVMGVCQVYEGCEFINESNSKKVTKHFIGLSKKYFCCYVLLSSSQSFKNNAT